MIPLSVPGRPNSPLAVSVVFWQNRPSRLNCGPFWLQTDAGSEREKREDLSLNIDGRNEEQRSGTGRRGRIPGTSRDTSDIWTKGEGEGTSGNQIGIVFDREEDGERAKSRPATSKQNEDADSGRVQRGPNHGREGEREAAEQRGIGEK